MEHLIMTSFIIKLHMTSKDSCPLKFLVFFKNFQAEAQAGAEYLRKWHPSKLRDKVKWFHSGMTDKFHEDQMHALLVGDCFSHVATNATGMVVLI